jgi:hypothetical protein
VEHTVADKLDRSAKLSASAQKRWSRPGEGESQSIRMQQMWCNPTFRKRHKESTASKTYTAKGSIWITNGIERRRVAVDSVLPEGWQKGKEITAVKRATIAVKGSMWITDGHQDRRVIGGSDVPEGWRRGRS